MNRVTVRMAWMALPLIPLTVRMAGMALPLIPRRYYGEKPSEGARKDVVDKIENCLQKGFTHLQDLQNGQKEMRQLQYEVGQAMLDLSRRLDQGVHTQNRRDLKDQIVSIQGAIGRIKPGLLEQRRSLEKLDGIFDAGNKNVEMIETHPEYFTEEGRRKMQVLRDLQAEKVQEAASLAQQTDDVLDAIFMLEETVAEVEQKHRQKFHSEIPSSA